MCLVKMFIIMFKHVVDLEVALDYILILTKVIIHCVISFCKENLLTNKSTTRTCQMRTKMTDFEQLRQTCWVDVSPILREDITIIVD